MIDLTSLVEISENEQRENFTVAERMDYANILEDIERTKAKERMLHGKKSDPVPEWAQGQGRTREIVALKVGISRGLYKRARYIANNAPDMLEVIDCKETTISDAYDAVRAKEKQTEIRLTPAISIKSEKSPSVEMCAVARIETNISEDTKPTAHSRKKPPQTPYMQRLHEQEVERIRKLREYEACLRKAKLLNSNANSARNAHVPPVLYQNFHDLRSFITTMFCTEIQ